MLNNSSTPSGRWAIFDDFFPNLLTGFRIAEYNAYLAMFPRLTIYTRAAPLKDIARGYNALYPQFVDRIRPFRGASDGPFGFAYLNFLNNAFDFLPYFKNWKTPFVFTLYPGGGFGFGEAASNMRLDSLTQSEYLRHIIVTQRRTDEYLASRSPNTARTMIFGCVANPMYFPEELRPRTWFGNGKPTLDVCFVAEKYIPHGWNKGYPVFVEACRKIAMAFPEVRIHVVGSYGESDWELRELSGRVRFYGRLTTQELSAFFTRMDVMISPNLPFRARPDNFDGFPTAASVEASLSGVAIVATDVLNLNSHYAPDSEIVIAPPYPGTIAAAATRLAQSPDLLRSVALAGQAKSRKLFEPALQIGRRVAILEREAASAGVTL